jgi:hypothetical protein
MKRIVFMGFFVLLTFALAAQDALIEELFGTVEVQRPGSAAWIPAEKNMALDMNSIISTGFKSTAKIRVGNSAITARPLTRLSLKELSAAQGTEKVTLNLQTGRVRAEVNPPRSGRTDFNIRSPSATASVRGTVFEFDTVNLAVESGTVVFRPADPRTAGSVLENLDIEAERAPQADAAAPGVPAVFIPSSEVFVDTGGASFVDTYAGLPSAPAESETAALTPALPPAVAQTGISTTPPPSNQAAATGVGIAVSW